MSITDMMHAAHHLAAMTTERDEAVRMGRENAEKFAAADARLQATLAARE